MIPEFDIEAKVDMEVLMMIIVEDAVWLPGLPPERLEFIAPENTVRRGGTYLP